MTSSDVTLDLPADISISEIILKAQDAIKDNNYDLALKLFEWALKNNKPVNEEFYFYQSQAFLSAGKLVEGIKAMENAYLLKPKDGFYIINFALTLLKGNLVEQALSLLDEIDRDHPAYFIDSRRLRFQIHDQDRLTGVVRN